MQRLRFALLLILSFPATASASPWTLPKNRVALVAGFDYGVASREYFQQGGARDFPLQGRYTASSFSVGARFGFTDRLEFEAVVPLKLISYDADPVILLPSQRPEPDASFDYYQENIIDLNQTAAGIGDLQIAARYQWMKLPFALATEIRVKAPTGYDRPAGTFGEEPESTEEFVNEVARFVRPGNIQDDVTLGDGQLDVSAQMLFGYILPTNTFVRADLGYNLRMSGAGDQLLGSIRVGQLLSQRFLAYAAIGGRYTVEDGRVIGISVAAEDPSLPAAEYGGLTNLLLREVRLERDELQAVGGIIVRFGAGVEMNAAYRRTLWGRNTAQADAVSVSFGVSTDITD